MRKVIFLVLLAFGAVDTLQASTVKYAEGYYTVPNYMTEVPADDVRASDANPQGRSFVARDSNGQVFFLVASYRDISKIADEKTWLAAASVPEQRLIQEVQSSLVAMPDGGKVTVDSAKANLAAHKIISTATIDDFGTISRLVTGILVLNNRKSLHLEVYVDESRFDELLPEVNKIVDSLSANPEFQLK